MFVRVSETYDLSTKTNKMGFVGIHTPTSDLVTRKWAGLLQNHRFVRFHKCDVAMACASMLPADPLQVGVEAGDIAPQDMFNPILYKAVSNDSMSNLELWLESHGFKGSSTINNSLNKNSVRTINDAVFKNSKGDEVDQFDMYYALLSDADDWKKAMPQSGLQMRGLFPLVYNRLYTDGMMQFDRTATVYGAPADFVASPSDQDDTVGATPNIPANMLPTRSFKGRAVRMPKFPTTSFAYANTGATGNDAFFSPDSQAFSNLRAVPACYVGVVVLPPAKLNVLYYRLKVTWTIEITDPRPLTDLQDWEHLALMGAESYGSDYLEQSSRMSVKTAMVDADGATVQKIMEGS